MVLPLRSSSSTSEGSLMAPTSIPDVEKQMQVMLPCRPSRACSWAARAVGCLDNEDGKVDALQSL